MSERQTGPYETVARKWLALVERRQEHFIELCDTGRWRHYYTQAEFLEEMRKVLCIRDQWAAIAGVPLSDEMPIEGDGSADKPFRSTAPRRGNGALPAARWPI